MGALLWTSWNWLATHARDKRGEINAAAVVGGFIVLVAYLAAPEAFHSFFKYVLNMVFSALRDSFGSDAQSPAGGRGGKNIEFQDGFNGGGSRGAGGGGGPALSPNQKVSK